VLTPGCNADWVDEAAPLKVALEPILASSPAFSCAVESRAVRTHGLSAPAVETCTRPSITDTSVAEGRRSTSKLRSNRLNHIDARENAKWTRWIMLDFEEGLAFKQLNLAPVCCEKHRDAAFCVQMND